MNKIKFSHKYPKLIKRIDTYMEQEDELHYVETAVLFHCFVINSEDMCNMFVGYDTIYDREGVDAYPLPKGKVIVLLFYDDNDGCNFLFTTIRRHTESKLKYYQSLVGQEFEVVINEEEKTS